MIKQFMHTERSRMTLILILMSLFCFILSLIRFYFSETKIFLFLNWNLFLAFIPWTVSTIIVLKNKNSINKLALIFLLFSWLLFFPNAPYILTDLFHLQTRNSVPIWFDLVVILSFAWTALTFGFLSLVNIEAYLSNFIKPILVRFTTVFLLFAGSFGVYLGRYLRWNSWDIINYPRPIISDIADRFLNPLSHPRTWGLTILMGILLNMMFWTIKLFTSKKEVAKLN